MTKIYRGRRDKDGRCRVTVTKPPKPQRALNPRLGLANHSPTGFEWGYEGSGPAQLAIALLADALENDDRAVNLHQQFKRKVIARLEKAKRWIMTSDEIKAFAEGQ